MFEVFKPTSLDRFHPGDDGLQAMGIAALGLFPDLVSELLDTLICRESHPLFELVSQKFKDSFLAIDDLCLGRMQD
jgi:hypothetical protein